MKAKNFTQKRIKKHEKQQNCYINNQLFKWYLNETGKIKKTKQKQQQKINIKKKTKKRENVNI